METDKPAEVVEQATAPTTTSTEHMESGRDEESEEEEEFLIMADIGHDIDQDTVLEHASKSEIRAINIDGVNPYVQIGPYTFQGQYNYVLGTNLFFSTTASAGDHRNEEASSTPNHAHDLHLIGLSDKKLNLSRVYIYPKKNDDPSNS